MRVLKHLLQQEVHTKCGSEVGSILRGSGVVEKLLGRFLKQCGGADYVLKVLQQFARDLKESVHDAGQICLELHAAISASAGEVPGAMRAALHSLREACESDQVPWPPLVGGAVMLRLFVPALMAGGFGARGALLNQTTLLTTLLQKMASGNLFAES